ncbi:DEAD/DEAH box helicase family protein [Sphingomonas sp. Leaf30]|uniref:DEAD/DEAH box helicase family protein n=1 Tax=Sphingomonas sp. Leaf30 TaxID=1736213 RepID=UPI000B33CDAD|nr:DEAD/DEAH box helicase family protein [Sphingomonas sp. Leaf30]
MTLDFSRLSIPKKAGLQTDPFKIFASLPRIENAPNDLWRGQAQALTQWHENRKTKDALVSLNTGAGKTLVGLLIAKSFCNEGLENVIYVCPTIDLVNQTAKQARAIGIETTTRVRGGYDNDLFETGKSFCITTYQALFSGHSSIQRQHFPQAVIFDDAHVAEAMMRDAFSIRFSKHSHPDLYSAVVAIYRQQMANIGHDNEYKEAIGELPGTSQSMLIPPDISASTAGQLSAALNGNGAPTDENLKYSYQHLKDKLDRCAVVLSNGSIEITPPFLPSLALNIFSRSVRRVYLSATLHNKADIIRAFGKEPSIVIEPDNDAGNGERLIIFERGLAAKTFSTEYISTISKTHKTLIAVPSYKASENWASIATPPAPKDFSDALDNFRNAKSGAFVLVSRVDGIDLPHDTCRLMVIDGIPIGDSLLERFQFDLLNMRSFSASRTANRIVQLFGRINRGRSDFGAFLITGRKLNSWLNTDKNVALLPPLLQNQILLGRHVQEGMDVSTTVKVQELLSKVLLSRPRDQKWLNYYSDFLEASEIDADITDRARKMEARNLAAAAAEAQFAKYAWEGDYESARDALDSIVAETARADEKLAGWHNLWIGACLHKEGDIDEGRFYYARARGQLGYNLIVYTGPIGRENDVEIIRSRIVESLNQIVSLAHEGYNRQLNKIRSALAPLDGASPRQMEEAARYLGELLGFESTRPDNDLGTGPDVLWADPGQDVVLGLELKTDKNEESQYNKEDIGQCLNHLEWMNDKIIGKDSLGVLLIGEPTTVSAKASPNKSIFYASSNALSQIRDELIGLVEDIHKMIPLQRLDALETSTRAGWDLRDISERLLTERFV